MAASKSFSWGTGTPVAASITRPELKAYLRRLDAFISPGLYVLGRSSHAEHHDHVGGVGGMKARCVLTDITNLATMRARAIPSSTHTRPRGLANCCVGRRDPKGASRKDTSEGPPRRSGGPSLITKVLVTRPFSRPTVNPVAATDSSLLLVESRRR
jgi:hypothetical protein